MLKTAVLLGGWLVVATASVCLGFEPADRATAGRKVKIGAVAYAPSAVTIFEGITRHLNQGGLPSDYVLYSNYDSLVEALEKGEVDIAWNTPLAHGKYHLRSGCESQTLVMRDVDVGVRSILVARADSGIESLGDLRGKRLVLGSEQAAEATILPRYFLQSEGINFEKLTVVSLDGEVDGAGNPCASPWHVISALEAGRGEAGIVTAEAWKDFQADLGRRENLREVWTSPAFSHCVFTASADFDRARAAKFIELMTAMKPSDASCAEVLRLEGAAAWLPGSPEGFETLIEALKNR